jgi:hypothetical protein
MTREQLLILVILVFVLLLNLLARLLRRRVKGEALRGVEPQAPPIPSRAYRRAPSVAEPPRAREGPHAAPVPVAVPPGAPPRRARSPVGGLQGVRRGIVLMTILRPCRALEPPDALN